MGGKVVYDLGLCFIVLCILMGYWGIDVGKQNRRKEQYTVDEHISSYPLITVSGFQDVSWTRDSQLAD